MITAAELRANGKDYFPVSAVAMMNEILMELVQLEAYKTTIHFNTLDHCKEDINIVERQFKNRGYNVKRIGEYSMEISW